MLLWLLAIDSVKYTMNLDGGDEIICEYVKRLKYTVVCFNFVFFVSS